MARFDVEALDPAVLAFVGERHLATLSIARDGRSPHVTPVGFTWDDTAKLARVITWATSHKAELVGAAGPDGARVTIGQVDGARWLTLEGSAIVTDDAERCADGVRRYAERYRPPKERDDRVVLEIAVDRITGRA